MKKPSSFEPIDVIMSTVLVAALGLFEISHADDLPVLLPEVVFTDVDPAPSAPSCQREFRAASDVATRFGIEAMVALPGVDEACAQESAPR
jgi:hypothetical protein